MKLSILLIINAVVSLAYGIGLLLLPATLLELYGITPTPDVQLMAQLVGGPFVAIGLLTWFARNVVDPTAQRAIMLSLVISGAIGVIVTLLGTLSGVFNALGWSAVAIYLLLTLGYAYFLFMKPSAA
jgi:hypothetical protein